MTTDVKLRQLAERITAADDKPGRVERLTRHLELNGMPPHNARGVARGISRLMTRQRTLLLNALEAAVRAEREQWELRVGHED